MKNMKKLLFFVFGVLITIALLPAAAFADEINPQNPQTITDGDTLSVVIEAVGDDGVYTEAQCAWFEFIPEKDGVYTFEGYKATDESTGAFEVSLFDEMYKKSAVYGIDESGHFKLSEPLYEGVIYYFRVECFDGIAGNFTVHLYHDEKTVFSAQPVGDTRLMIKTNTSLTLEVLPPPDEVECSYQWYVGSEPVSGGDQTIYQTAPITEDCRIKCEVSDAYGNICHIQYMIMTIKEFSASAIDDERTVYPGDRVVLETEAYAPGELSYQWYKLVRSKEVPSYDEVLIEGETGETLVIEKINPDSAGGYKCVVTELETGTTKCLSFWINFPENNLQAADKETGNSWRSLEVKPEAPLKLEVEASAIDMSVVSYQWRVKYYKYKYGIFGDEEEDIVNATSNVLDIPAAKASGVYICHVEDIFGNEKVVEYSVRVVTGLNAYDKKTKETILSADTLPGQSVTLTVEAASDMGLPLKYQWAKEEIELETETGGHMVLIDIPGATSPSYTVKNPERSVYACVVTDGYRNYSIVNYFIHVENNLELKVKTPKSGTTVYVPYNGTATLEVEAKAKTGKVHYSWEVAEYKEYGYSGPDIAVNKVSTSAKLILKNIKMGKHCHVWVSDDYGGGAGLDFDVFVDTGLTAYASGTKKTTVDINVVPKCNAVLSVDASVKTKKKLEYRWEVLMPDRTDENGDWYEGGWESVSGGGTKSYTVSNVTKNQKYRCTVYDRYGGKKSVTFNVKLADKFTDAANEKAYYYDPVYWAVENGITVGAGGNGKFSPNEACTREQIVTFLWRLMGEPEPQKIETFADVKADAWYAKPISWAYEQGITTGLNDGTGRFGVGQPCKREMCVTFLYRAAGKPAVQGGNCFTDMTEGAYYVDAVTWAVNNGITTGLNDGTGRFGVGQTCTRAMIVTFLYRYAQLNKYPIVTLREEAYEVS